MKYELPRDQGEVLPNLLGLTTQEEIAMAEFEGFTEAEIILTEELDADVRFNSVYIQRIHQLALGHLYAFAGKWRDVNLSKGGFSFAAARFLPETMRAFDSQVVVGLKGAEPDELIRDIAMVHAELLFIHPFREGNGRTARILANLMTRKSGRGALHFERIDEKTFHDGSTTSLVEGALSDLNKGLAIWLGAMTPWATWAASP